MSPTISASTPSRTSPTGSRTNAASSGSVPSSWPSEATPPRRSPKPAGVSRRAVQHWVARYNTNAPDGLADRPKSGRPPLLTDLQIEQLRQRIDAGPQPEDGVCTLRGPEIRAIIAREFGVTYTQPAVYFLLHRLGYACLDPRPRHLKADPKAQEEFKKNRRPHR